MSANQSTFTLRQNYKNFKPGVHQIERNDLIPYSSQKSCFYILFSFVVSIAFLAGVLWSANLTLIVPILVQAFGHDTISSVTHCKLEQRKSGQVMAVAYRYTWNGGIYASSEDISLSEAARFNFEDYCYSGTPLPIRILDANPRWSSVLVSGARSSPESAIVLVIFGLASCLVIYDALHSMVWNAKAVMVHPRLMRQSTLLDGEILSIRDSTLTNVLTIKYGFEATRKKYLTGYAEVRRDDLRDRPLPHVGTPVVVLYADDHAHIML